MNVTAIGVAILLATPLLAQQPSSQPSADELARQRAAADEKLRNDWPDLHKYQDANAKLPPPMKNENRVVFMGNSITEGWAPHFATMFPGKPYIGRGISGQTTPPMLVRFKQDVVALEPKVVVILAGTNDIAGNTGPSTLEMIENNIASMAEIAQANGIRVVLSSILPVYDYPWRPGLEPAPKIIAINKWLKQWAHDHRAVYLDYHSAMADERGGMNPQLASDGVHPTLAAIDPWRRSPRKQSAKRCVVADRAQFEAPSRATKFRPRRPASPPSRRSAPPSSRHAPRSAAVAPRSQTRR